MSWRRTTAEQGLFYRDNRRMFEKYAGQYILLQMGEVKWHDPSGIVTASRRVLSGENPDPKALNKKWLDKVKVTVTQVYKTASKKPEDWNYYRASATVLTIEANQPRSVLFYLPGDIVKRDMLPKEPDYYFVQLEVAGNEAPIFDARGVLIPAQVRAVHKDIANKVAFDAAKDAADRGVVNTPGILRPQYLVAYFDNPIVPSSPEFIREDVPTR